MAEMKDGKCPFCNGLTVASEMSGDGQRPMALSAALIQSMFGEYEPPNHYGIHLEHGDWMHFDNSCGEYADGMIQIRFCPICGRALKGLDDGE